MMRKFLLTVGMGLAPGATGAAMAPTEASAGWRRGGFHGPRFHAVRIHRVHRPHFRYHRRVVHRHRYFPRHRFYRSRHVVHIHRGYRPHYRYRHRVVYGIGTSHAATPTARAFASCTFTGDTARTIVASCIGIGTSPAGAS